MKDVLLSFVVLSVLQGGAAAEVQASALLKSPLILEVLYNALIAVQLEPGEAKGQSGERTHDKNSAATSVGEEKMTRNQKKRRI